MKRLLRETPEKDFHSRVKGEKKRQEEVNYW